MTKPITRKRSILVSLDAKPRIVNGIEVIPWEIFLKRLWAGENRKNNFPHWKKEFQSTPALSSGRNGQVCDMTKMFR